MTQEERLYTHRDVVRITGLPERQILNWSGKGLIEARKPAKKSGARREYDYTNILEIALCRILFDIFGFQFYTVKMILQDLRRDGILADWIEEWGQIEREKKQEFKGADLPLGILLYMFLENGSTEKWIVHEDPELTAETFVKPFLAKTSLLYRGFFAVNLMNIKREIDRML